MNIFFKKNRNETFFNCAGRSLQNTEPYYDGLYNDVSIPNVEYVKLEDNKVKAELNNKLANKADLGTNNEQTFNSIINIPDFNQGNSNTSNVMNKKYIDAQDMTKADKKYADDTFLSKKTGGIMDNIIQFNQSNPENQRQIHYLGNPQYNSSAASKSYVDSAVQNILKDDEVMDLDGKNAMKANLDMGCYNIINLKNPNNDVDAANKLYVDTSLVTSVGRENVFNNIMTNSASQLTEEKNIKFGNLIDHPNPHHKINKKVLDTKLIFDSSHGYYSSRLGINMYPIAINKYTIAFEMYFPTEIDHDSVDISFASSIDTVNKVTTRVFNGYSRTIAQINKYQQQNNNYLHVNIVLKMKSGHSYVPQLQTYIVIYGIKSYESNIDPSVYDQIYYIAHDQIVFNGPINMNKEAIYGIQEGTDDDQAVNFKQLYSYYNALRISIENRIKLLQPKSYYNETFEYFFDLLDPNSFDMDNTYGSNMKSIGGKLMLKNTISLADYDPKQGLGINKSHIQLDNILNKDSNFTLFVSFLHDNSLKGQDYYIGLGDNANTFFKPYIVMRNNKFLIRKPTHTSGGYKPAHALESEEDILSLYQNKHIFFMVL